MKELLDISLFAVVILNLMLLSSNRLFACIKMIAAQGMIIGLVPLIVHKGPFAPEILPFAAGTVTVKGFVFPWLLFRALREAGISREVEPLVSYPVSVMMGVIALALSFRISSVLPLAPEILVTGCGVPIAFSTILTGLFIIITRMKALTQVIGYLVLENGIYCLSVILFPEQPVLVELGILLDIFVAVFVMGIAIFHINREFDHIDTYKLYQLEDWKADDTEAAK